MTDEVLTFGETVVSPFTELLDGPNGRSNHRGGPDWPDWDSQLEARHRQRGRPVDARPVPVSATATLPRLAWCGPVTRHYGHQIADFSMRLLSTAVALPDVPMGFATSERYRTAEWQQAPPFFHGILSWFDIPLERCELITQPTLIHELYVLPQAEQLHGPGPSEEHLDLLDAHTGRKLGGDPQTGGALYVSRAGVHARLAGEAYLEQMLRGAGIAILRPETVTIPEQIAAYREADVLLFAEGSALHTLQLAGRIAAAVAVIVRRPGQRLAESSVAPRARSLDYLEVARGIVHGTKPFGIVGGVSQRWVPAPELGISILDPDVLIAKLSGVGIDVGSGWDSAEFERVRDQDVIEWLSRESRAGRLGFDGAADAIEASLADAGVGHLSRHLPTAVEGSRLGGVARPAGATGGQRATEIPHDGTMDTEPDWLETYRAQGFLQVDGWVNPRALDLVRAVDAVQSELGATGGVMEIGVFGGQFFMALNGLVKPDHRSLAVDLFSRQDLNVDGSGRADLDVFRSNLAGWDRHGGANVEILAVDSTMLSPADVLRRLGQRPRMVSVDGGHTAEHIASDLELAERILHPQGVVFVSDILNSHWLGIVEGTVRYLDRRPTLWPFALGFNKLLLCPMSVHGYYLKHFRTRVEGATRLVRFCGYELQAFR